MENHPPFILSSPTLSRNSAIYFFASYSLRRLAERIHLLVLFGAQSVLAFNTNGICDHAGFTKHTILLFKINYNLVKSCLW